MQKRIMFVDLFKNTQIAAVVCKNDANLTVVFANTNAFILLNPFWIVDRISAPTLEFPLEQLLQFSNKSELDNVKEMIGATGQLGWYHTTLIPADGNPISATLVGNTLSSEGADYVVFYILREAGTLDDQEMEAHKVLFSILHTSYHAADIDKAISSILAIAGEYMRVSRAYVFEDLYNGYTRNTYEWCARGVAPVIQTLQNVPKDDYNYTAIIDPPGLYVAGDVSTLPENDYAILSPQGVKAVAMLPMYNRDTPIGYIGYADCANTRVWSLRELQFLKEIASTICSLIMRRNVEAEARRSLGILQTITDNIDLIVYVNDPETYEIKFINHTLAMDLGIDPVKSIGRPCWQVLQANMDGPCPFCPMPKLYDENKQPIQKGHEWELQNTRTGHWYWAKDSIIPWIDGTLMHFELAMQITLRKQYEKQLERFASIDAMTGVYNREWGYKLLEKLQEETRREYDVYSLCFIDLDGLKKINDTYGHNAGDEMLHIVVDRIRQRIRGEDMICRWGGDEFLVELRCNEKSADEIMRAIQEDLQKVSQTMWQYAVPLGFSYGVADLLGADTIDAVVTIADGRMYKNKMAKRECQSVEVR
jgi:diguanylate cyclase (GGDEF)-like protein